MCFYCVLSDWDQFDDQQNLQKAWVVILWSYYTTHTMSGFAVHKSHTTMTYIRISSSIIYSSHPIKSNHFYLVIWPVQPLTMTIYGDAARLNSTQFPFPLNKLVLILSKYNDIIIIYSANTTAITWWYFISESHLKFKLKSPFRFRRKRDCGRSVRTCDPNGTSIYRAHFHCGISIKNRLWL